MEKSLAIISSPIGSSSSSNAWEALDQTNPIVSKNYKAASCTFTFPEKFSRISKTFLIGLSLTKSVSQTRFNSNVAVLGEIEIKTASN